MSNRRDFVGSGVAMAAASVAGPGSANGRPLPRGGAVAVRLFIYQAANPDAIEAGRVMAGQGVPVLGLDAADAACFERELRQFWRLQPVNVVGLTDESGFRQVLALASEFGFELAHSAPAHRAGLVNWIVGPSG